jgi:integrase
MATYYKRQGKQGVRWLVRVRIKGRKSSKTFMTKASAESWARAQETAIETGKFEPVEKGVGVIFADLIDGFIGHRKDARKTPGKTFANSLARLKEEHGLEPAAMLTGEFWRSHVRKRMAAGVESHTAVCELAYASSVLSWAKRQGLIQDASGPAEARAICKADQLRLVSRSRTRRITDAELDALLAACDDIASSVPVGDIVRFALATSMRRGEILRLLWTDINEDERIAVVRNRKHPKDQERVDDVPLLPKHTEWPRWDALEIIKAQPRNTSLVFPYLDDTLGERFERACEKANLNGIVFHLLRHESLSRYAKRKFDLFRLQLIGGHRDIRQLQRYVGMDARDLVAETELEAAPK